MNPALESLIFALNEQPPSQGEILFLGAEPDSELPEVVGWQPLKPLAVVCEAAGMKLVEEPSGVFQTIFSLPGKSKEETLAGFAKAYDLLGGNGTLVVGIANSAGASRFEKELKKATPLLYSVSKNKCRTFAVSKQTPWNAELLAEWRELGKTTTIPETPFLTEPGVFSAKHIDPGSALLAEHLPASLRGKVADLGAGWGFLSHAALGKAPNIQQIDLFEADRRALKCAKVNISGKAVFHWHDVTSGLPDSYDYIITNPPFHTAQSKDVDLGKQFLSVAAASLRRGGSMYLVANRQLPYEAHLTELGLRARQIAENHAYKVIFAS